MDCLYRTVLRFGDWVGKLGVGPQDSPSQVFEEGDKTKATCYQGMYILVVFLGSIQARGSTREQLIRVRG